MVPGVSSWHHPNAPQSISFSGSGFMATYQLGVAQCFLNHAPWIVRTAPCVLGASAGSLVAAAVVCEISLIMIRDEMLQFARQMKAFALGPFNPSINVLHWLEYVLPKYLPSDAHRMASGRLAVTMTRLTDGKHIVMSEFQSKEDVVQALLCSCFVPGYCGTHPPSFKGVYYMDGGFSSFQPVVPSQTLTVSPFSGDIDICPADTTCTWDLVVSGATLKGNVANIVRMFNAIYPMTLEDLEQAYHSGYKDAIHFLLHNDLSPCLTIRKLCEGPLNGDETKTLMQLDSTVKDEEEVKVEEETASQTSFIDNRCMQIGSSKETELTRNQPSIDATMHFDMVQNVLLGNVVAYMSMFKLPARILSYLLFPLMLSFYTVLQSRRRLEWLFMQAPEWVFLAWHCLRHFTVFVFSIFISSFKKSINNRVIPIILFLQWLKIHSHYEAAQEAINDLPKKPKFYSSAH
ncbi:patatin-like phospholipase domain-containing protein 2 [Anabas testudineus]|uniref:patatin-like phospholipase domain-containing protein 2 n=1 Tax=Anabas testudineus TaxID=64144 RepID=UPI000E45C6D1|nr:patatin-like phospholipase domain-containing protein 2 [Anabas testudineus]